MPEWALTVISALLAGGLVGGIIAALKVGKEREQISVTTAQKAAAAAGAVIDDLREQIADIRVNQVRVVTELNERITGLETENTELRERIVGLELERDNLVQQVRILEAGQ